LYAIGVVFDHEFILKTLLLEQLFRKTGNPLPEQTLNLSNTDAVLFGSVDDTNLNPIQGLLNQGRRLVYLQILDL
jgi:isocitrate/isopropylmalate dehydrogenase